ncbi:MAG TPA: hypothetical protein PLJ11_04245 [Methanomassiliicoccales archaeon]|nr:hypothetical protein [Methanomassiliicoccales archaeon]
MSARVEMKGPLLAASAPAIGRKVFEPVRGEGAMWGGGRSGPLGGRVPQAHCGFGPSSPGVADRRHGWPWRRGLAW